MRVIVSVELSRPPWLSHGKASLKQSDRAPTLPD